MQLLSILLSLQSTMNEYIESPFNESVKDIMKKVTENYLASFITISQIICGIGAVIYIGTLISKSLASGGQERLDLWKLSRPVAILLLITLCNSVVCPAIDLVIEEPLMALTKDCHKKEQESIAEKREMLKDIKISAEEHIEDIEKSNGKESTDFSFVRLITGKDLGTQLTDIIWFAFESLADIIMCVAKLIIVMISALYKIILKLFAPFAFALSMFPYFHDNLKHWVGRYIHASLWIPISYVLELIQNCCTESYLDKQIAFYQTICMSGTYDVASAGDGFQCFTGIILSLVIACMYLSIPTLASSIVQSAGGEFMTGTAMSGISLFGKILGVSANAPATAAKGVEKTKKVFGKMFGK